MEIKLNKGAKIWLTSDLHFCHDREFIWGPRGFKNVTEMNKVIRQNWCNVVKYDDYVIVLGDCMLNNDEEGLRYLQSLPGHIKLIRGNHDSDARCERYIKCFNCQSEPIMFADVLHYGGYKFYLSHYPTIAANGDADKPLSRQMINLCGHLHTKDKFVDMDKGQIYHCELDAHGNTPVSLDQIIADIKKYRGIQ